MAQNSIEHELSVVSLERGVSFGSSYAFIRCPFHSGGNESRASMIVNTSDPRFPLGFYNCFSCGEKGPWNQLAKELCLQEFAEGEQQREMVSQTKLVLGAGLTIGSNVPGLPWEPRRLWRGIKGDLLSRLEAKLTFNFNTKSQEIYLPCRQMRKDVGGIYALLEKSQQKTRASYRNSEGAWVKESLFPFDYVRNLVKEGFNYNTPVFIVEGPRDALNLLQHGIPSLALLGCNNWSPSLLSLLYTLNCRDYVILMDGDAPGRDAAKRVSEDFKQSLLKSRFSILSLPEGRDPGEMEESQINGLRGLYYSE